MEYETKKNDYSLLEFYQSYRRKLPKIVWIAQGFCGEMLDETFDYGQVLRIHSICRQQRVIAVRLTDQGTEDCTYSFPVNYPIQFCLSEGVYQNDKNSMTLAEILDKKELPVEVIFARKQFVKVGENTSSTSHFSSFRLTKIFDEIYMLGNFVLEGELDPEIVRIPLYLTAIRFSEVIGLKQKDRLTWKTFQRQLDEHAAKLNFDSVGGNKEIAKYKSDSATKSVSSELEDDHLIYEHFQPDMYTNLAELIGKDRSSACVDVDDDGLYEPVVPREQQRREWSKFLKKKEKKGETKQDATQKQKTEQDKGKNPEQTSQRSLVSELASRIESKFKFKNIQSQRSNPRPLSSKPTLSTSVGGFPFRDQQLPEKDTQLEGVDRNFRSIVRHTSILSKSDVFAPSSKTYENTQIGRAEIRPMVKPKPSPKPTPSFIPNQDYMETRQQFQNQPYKVEQPEKTIDKEIINVKELSIGQLGKLMKEKLRLGDYVSRFENEMVDGAMLFELDEAFLKEEFSLKAIEAKRLMKFAKEGHVPQY